MRRTAVLAAALMAAGGCQHPAADPADGPDAMAWAQGRIRSVDARRGFAIVECDLLPAAGRRLRVIADGRAAGWVRITERRRGAWVAAEIEEGEPRVGDWVVGAGFAAED